jgi:hypothetical protein
MKVCPNPQCRARATDDRLIACEKCGTPFSEPTATAGLNLTPEQENALLKRLFRRTAYYIFGGLSLMTAIGVIQLALSFGTLYRAGVKKVEDLLVDRVNQEFETERVKKTITEVAQDQAKYVLRAEIDPQVEQFKRDSEKKIASFEGYLNEMRNQYAAQYQTLAREVTRLKERNEILKLADDAIITGSREALNELQKVMNGGSDENRRAARAAIFQVKEFYLMGSRSSDFKLVIRKLSLVDGFMDVSPDSDDKYETRDLMAELSSNQNWRTRAKCAQILGGRKLQGVPEALLDSMGSDDNLEVVRDAVRAFEGLTGFRSPDIFGYQQCKDWWKENGSEFSKGLQPFRDHQLNFRNDETTQSDFGTLGQMLTSLN